VSAVPGLLVLVPLTGALVCGVLPARWGSRTGLVTAAAVTGLVGAVVLRVLDGDLDNTVRTASAGYEPPLGITLVVDGLSAAFLAMTAVVGLGLSVYATGTSRARGGRMFWPLWLGLWSALNAVYVSGDLFNAYVALELMGLAAVGLVALAGADALAAALRYLLIAVLGSLAYLLGVGLVYGELGTLDMQQVGQAAGRSAVTVAALALMTVGMALKTALFPLHGWLPAAHAGAPPAVSPALSALVVKASLYLVVRLWSSVLPDVGTPAATQLLGALGALAVLWGTVAALRQDRLKLVVAYSTVAQVGYLFLVFPLALTQGTSVDVARDGWAGALGLGLAHGLAKAAMFMAAGTLALAHGTDRLSALGGAVTRRPVACATFALAGVSLAGLPPSGGFAAKWLLLQSSLGSGQWWWAAVLLVGGLLTAAYVGRVLRVTFIDQPIDPPGHQDGPLHPVPTRMEVVALALALIAVVGGFRALEVVRLLTLGSPFGVAA
jgi:multicomponent Na+:H+ antiporter subunit D